MGLSIPCYNHKNIFFSTIESLTFPSAASFGHSHIGGEIEEEEKERKEIKREREQDERFYVVSCVRDASMLSVAFATI